jgi:two-component system phosphate regulon response regulator PhoB
MLTVKNADADVALGLELGADDYITKPFSPRVLVARVRAILRRKTAQPSESGDVLQIGDLLMHVGRHEAALKGDMIDLTVTEFRLLHLLALKPGWVFTRNQIIDSVRGENIAVTDRSVDAHIVTLRKKLGAYGTLIETVRGMGYRFKSLENK